MAGHNVLVAFACWMGIRYDDAAKSAEKAQETLEYFLCSFRAFSSNCLEHLGASQGLDELLELTIKSFLKFAKSVDVRYDEYFS